MNGSNDSRVVRQSQTFPETMMESTFQPLNRRHWIRVAEALGLLPKLQRIMPAYAFEHTGPKASPVGDSEADERDLLIREQPTQFGKGRGAAITNNGTVPDPLVRVREGSDAVCRATNGLKEDISIHWHELLLPPGMDRLPGVSSPRMAGRKQDDMWAIAHPRQRIARGKTFRLAADRTPSIIRWSVGTWKVTEHDRKRGQ